jgi:preprotein translocase subunit SecA
LKELKILTKRRVQEMDAFRKEAYEVSEKTLLDILPEVAVVKETARRFKDNSQISVTASALDREFSGIKAYVV